MFVYDDERVAINFIGGGITVNNIDNNGIFQVGDADYDGFSSNVKFNLISQVYGASNLINVQPVGSPINDPDGVDTPMPTNQIPLGIED